MNEFTLFTSHGISLETDWPVRAAPFYPIRSHEYCILRQEVFRLTPCVPTLYLLWHTVNIYYQNLERMHLIINYMVILRNMLNWRSPFWISSHLIFTLVPDRENHHECNGMYKTVVFFGNIRRGVIHLQNWWNNLIRQWQLLVFFYVVTSAQIIAEYLLLLRVNIWGPAHFTPTGINLA